MRTLQRETQHRGVPTPQRERIPFSPLSTLQPVHAFGRPNVDRLFDLNARHFLARLVEAQHGIVVHVEPLPVDLGFEHFRTRNDVVPEDDLLAGSPELEDGQQFPTRHEILLDGVVHARAEHAAGHSHAGCAEAECRSRWARCPTADTAGAPPAPRESRSTGGASRSSAHRPSSPIRINDCMRILPTQAAIQRVSIGSPPVSGSLPSMRG